MISRYKWYEVRLPSSASDFLSSLQTQSYLPDASSGFIVNPSELRFRYIWRSFINTTSLDIEGNQEHQEFSTVNYQEIQLIGDKKLFFRAENPARSTREMMNSLEKISGFGFACQQKTITNEHILSALEIVETKKLNSIKVSGAISKAKALARIELVSKDGLDLQKIDFLHDGEFTVDAASYEVIYKGVRGQIGFSKTGACKISGQLSEFLLARMESVILNN